ncbi:MAG: 23S rRNA (guanosine(2251)-2'-O)-methyltransferase RlmB [Mycoplasmatales bacterium]
MEKILDNIIYGKHNVLNTITSREVVKVFIQKDKRNHEIVEEAKNRNVPFVYVDKFKLDSMTDRNNHQGVACEISPINYLDIDGLISKVNNKKNPVIFIFDEITDVNNFGAILRTCDAFSIDGIIFSKRRNVQVNMGVAKASTGAYNYVDMARVTNIKQAIEKLKKNNFWVAHLDMDGEQEVSKVDFNMPICIVIGGENKGITDVMKKHCDFGISIPMTGHVNSLNIASAAAIIAFSATKGRNNE